MSTNLKNSVNKLLNPIDEQEEQVSGYQEKVNKLYNTIQTAQNPFLDKNGELFNKYIDYQKVLDNPNVKTKAKEFISQATGLSPSQSADTDYEAYSEASGISSPSKLGFISAKYESGGYDGGAVSSGSGDYGGVSYGIPQFSTTTGSADTFVNWLKKNNPEMGSYFQNYKAGTTEFSNAWKQVYSKYGDAFSNVQTTYAYNNFVKPLAEKAKQKTGVDYTRSKALQELVYSTAIQFGSGDLGLSALGNVTADMSDTDIINASYDKKIANYQSFFKGSSVSVQNSVKNRFANERKDVLSLVGSGSQISSKTSGIRTQKNSRGSKIANTAKQYLGTPYVWGGTSPTGFDCSGLMQYTYAKNGISIPRTSQAQFKSGKAVSNGNLQVGDLVFFKGSTGTSAEPGHVGMYIGNGQYIQAPRTGDVVKVSKLSDRSDYVGARRYY